MRTRARTKSTSVFAALLALCLATSASADHDPSHPHRDIPPIGGGGDAAFNDICRDGGYMIGVKIYLGAWVDHIAMVCSDYRSDLTWRPRYVSGYGGNGGNRTPKVGLCKDGWILAGLRLRFTKNLRQLHSVYGTCVAVAPDATGGGGWAIYPNDQQAAATESDLRGVTCRDGEAAAGISGRYGEHVNAIGLNCREYPPPALSVGPTPKKVGSAASKPIKKTGRPKDGSGGTAAVGGFLTCTGGGMNVEQKKDSVFVSFAAADQPAEDADPGRGQCAWTDRVVGQNESHRIAFSSSKDQADALIEVARNGGTFVIAGQPMTAFIMVNTIIDVGDQNGFVKKRIDRAKARAAADGDDGAGAGFAAAPAGDAVASPECPAGVATVATAQVGEEVLNVRAKPSRDAEIVAQVPDGSQVSVVGACFTGGAGFAKGKTLKPKGDGGKTRPDQAAQAGGWCRIDAPAQGCVKAEFLAFGQAPGKGAGLAKAKTLKPQGDGNAGEQPGLALTFAGKWSVTGDDGVGYSMTMTQKGTSVSGNYRGGDGSKGSFKGKVKGNVLRFSWKQTDGYSGSGKFALSDDGSSFDGSYSFGDNPDEAEGSWSGTRN